MVTPSTWNSIDATPTSSAPVAVNATVPTRPAAKFAGAVSVAVGGVTSALGGGGGGGGGLLEYVLPPPHPFSRDAANALMQSALVEPRAMFIAGPPATAVGRSRS